MIRGDKSSPELEQELVLEAVSLDRSKDERICKILEGTLDWKLLLSIATQQGIFPLCCQRIMASAEKQIPPEEIKRWKELLKVNTQKNLRLTWKLINCVELLANNGIECVVLKGPIYAIQAYAALGLRQYTDLDILIHRIDFPKAYDLLEKSGYVPAFKLDKKLKEFEIRTDNHFLFYHQGDVFEVHCEIGQREINYPLRAELMWQDLSVVHIFDKDVYSLSVENTITYACLHGAMHSWNQLKWIVDLAYLCQSISEISWPTLMDHARCKGLFRQVCLGLLLAEALVDVELPLLVHNQIKTDRFAQVLASRVKTNLFTISNEPPLIADLKFYLRTRERWQDRLKLLLDVIFIPKQRDWLTVSLPENLFFLYYVFRPLRLLYRLGKLVFTILF